MILAKPKNPLIILSVFASIFISCNKENQKSCWQAFSPSGFDVTGLTICDVTKAEAEQRYPNYWFYKARETKYCWKAAKTSDPSYPQYLWGVPQSMKSNLESTYGYMLSNVDCSSFCNLRWIERHQSKITGLYTANTLRAETLLSSDSCSRLTIGRVIVYRETSDSLITRELTDKKP